MFEQSLQIHCFEQSQSMNIDMDGIDVKLISNRDYDGNQTNVFIFMENGTTQIFIVSAMT